MLEVLHGGARVVWAANLIGWGVLGLAAMLLPVFGLRVMGLGLEVIARLAIGSGTLVYAGAVFLVLGWGRGSFVILTYGGITLLLWVGAYQIVRWLLAQKRAVEALEAGERGS